MPLYSYQGVSRSRSRAHKSEQPNGSGTQPHVSPGKRLVQAAAAGVEQALKGGVTNLGATLTRDACVRLFASGAASLQVGQMRRSFLDFTRLEAVCDLGLTSPQIGGQQAIGPVGTAAAAASTSAATMPTLRQPACALEHKGAWHALTVSAVQQLFGPVRLRADWRWALDSSVPCPQGAALLRPGAPVGVAKHLAAIRPSLVDSAYGLDVAVPGSNGLARVVAWCTPARKEAMLELRLM